MTDDFSWTDPLMDVSYRARTTDEAVIFEHYVLQLLLEV